MQPNNIIPMSELKPEHRTLLKSAFLALATPRWLEHTYCLGRNATPTRLATDALQATLGTEWAEEHLLPYLNQAEIINALISLARECNLLLKKKG